MWKLYSIKTIYRTKAIGKPDVVDAYYKKNIDMVEERIVVLKARNFDEAIRKGEKEANEYVGGTHINPYGQKVVQKYIGTIDVFEMFDDLELNAEIYSSTHLIPKDESSKKISDRIMGKEYKNELKIRKKFLNREFSGVIRKKDR